SNAEYNTDNTDIDHVSDSNVQEISESSTSITRRKAIEKPEDKPS
ncbi:16552_t:CDS:1, partial [Cetraspora pellucida]